jgi:hypothetical protein
MYTPSFAEVRQGRTGLSQTLKAVSLILASALCLFARPEQGSGKSPAQEITDLELRRAAAVVHRDIDLLDAITAADSVRILPTGALETKSQLLAQLKSGELTYSSINVDELSVKLYANTAVVTGRSEFQGQRDGKPFNGRCRFSRVWIKSSSGWQEVLFQLTALPAN